MDKRKDEEHEEAVAEGVSGAEPSQTPLTMASNSESYVSDGVLRRAKIKRGMLAEWGGEKYKRGILPTGLDEKESKHFLKRYAHLKEEVYSGFSH